MPPIFLFFFISPIKYYKTIVVIQRKAHEAYFLPSSVSKILLLYLVMVLPFIEEGKVERTVDSEVSWELRKNENQK